MNTSETPDIGKVTFADFEAFLASEGNEYWRAVDNRSFEEAIGYEDPISLDALMQGLIVHGEDSEFIYLFSGNEDSYEMANRTDWEKVPQISLAKINKYIVRWVNGSDFLWFTSSLEEATNGGYITLMKAEEELDKE